MEGEFEERLKIYLDRENGITQTICIVKYPI